MTAPHARAAELLTEAECIRRIRGRDSDVRDWLRGLSGVRRRSPTGGVLYDWLAVVEAMPLVDEALPGREQGAPRAAVTPQGRRRALRGR